MGGMVRSVLVAWVMALTGLAAAGCGDRPEFWDEPMVFGEPVALSSGGAFLSAERNELLVVRAQAGHDLAVARYDVARAAQIIDVLADDRIVLWSREAKTLDLVDPDGRTARSWDLGAPFSGFRVSPEGRYLVAWITGTGGDDALFVNAGQLAVVDLTEEPGLGNPRLLSLKSYGDAPVGVHIAPVVEAGGGDRQPALVAWRSYVSILDLRDPEVADVSVPLRPGDETMDIWPGPMKFADAGEGLVRAWFLSTSSADLYEITIAADQLPSQGSAAVAINLFPTAPGPMDFALYRLQSGDLRVATICSSARLVITDPESSGTEILTLAIKPDRLQVFEMPGLDGGVSLETFSLVSSGSYSQFYLVELEHVALKKSKALHLSSAPAPVADVLELPGQGQFLLFHAGGDAAISVAEPASDKLTSILGTGAMEDRLYLEEEDLLLVLTVRGGMRHLVAMDTLTLHARAVELDEDTGQGATLLPLPGEDMILVWLEGEQRLVRAPLDFRDRGDLVDYPMFFFDGLMN